MRLRKGQRYNDKLDYPKSSGVPNGESSSTKINETFEKPLEKTKSTKHGEVEGSSYIRYEIFMKTPTVVKIEYNSERLVLESKPLRKSWSFITKIFDYDTVPNSYHSNTFNRSLDKF